MTHTGGYGRAGGYGRVSTSDQSCALQLDALHTYATARAWTLTEYIDRGESGAKDRRPALDALMHDVRARRVDVVVVTKLDRLAQSVRQLVSIAGELEALGVDLVVLDQAIDTTTPAGRLLFHVLAAIAEFERDLIRERVVAGVRRAQQHGTRSGRPIGRPRRLVDAGEISRRRDDGQSWRTIARALKAPSRTLRRVARAGQKPQAKSAPLGPLSTPPETLENRQRARPQREAFGNGYVASGCPASPSPSSIPLPVYDNTPL